MGRSADARSAAGSPGRGPRLRVARGGGRRLRRGARRGFHRRSRRDRAAAGNRNGGFMTLRLGIDVGGTFTDVTAFDEDMGAIVVRKYLSDPAAPARVMDRITRDVIDDYG